MQQLQQILCQFNCKMARMASDSGCAALQRRDVAATRRNAGRRSSSSSGSDDDAPLRIQGLHLCIDTRTSVSVCKLQFGVYTPAPRTYMYVCIYICMQPYTYIRVCVCISVCLHVHSIHTRYTKRVLEYWSNGRAVLVSTPNTKRAPFARRCRCRRRVPIVPVVTARQPCVLLLLMTCSHVHDSQLLSVYVYRVIHTTHTRRYTNFSQSPFYSELTL